MNRKSAKPKTIPDHVAEIHNLVPDLKVIYTDVDGTLLGPAGCLFLTADRQYTLRPAQALLAALRAGVDVVPVSGRNRRQLFGDARILGLSNYIAELGCQLVYDQGRELVLNIHDSAGRIGDRQMPIKYLQALGVDVLLFDHFKNRLEHHTPWSEDRECTYVFRGLIDVDEANHVLAAEGFPDLQVIDNGRIHGVPGELETSLPEIRAYHLLPKGAGKAAGVKKDQEIRGFSRDQCVAIGDAFSDLEIAPEVGAFFLVDEVRADEIQSRGFLDVENVFVTRQRMGEGWAEVAELFIGPQAKT